jgi:dephospho-CoA kinase
MHSAKKDSAAWLFFRDALTDALEASFGADVVTVAPPDARANFAQWLLHEFVPRHKGKWPKNGSTSDLQDISTKVRAIFGEDTLEKAIIARVGQSISASPCVVIEGIRRIVDIGRLMRDPTIHFRLSYIEADPKKRYERHKKRNEKPGDADLTLPQFMKLGEAEAEQQIRLLKPEAHAIITNNGTSEEFAEKLYAEVAIWLAP